MSLSSLLTGGHKHGEEEEEEEDVIDDGMMGESQETVTCHTVTTAFLYLKESDSDDDATFKEGYQERHLFVVGTSTGQCVFFRLQVSEAQEVTNVQKVKEIQTRAKAPVLLITFLQADNTQILPLQTTRPLRSFSPPVSLSTSATQLNAAPAPPAAIDTASLSRGAPSIVSAAPSSATSFKKKASKIKSFAGKLLGRKTDMSQSNDSVVPEERADEEEEEQSPLSAEGEEEEVAEEPIARSASSVNLVASAAALFTAKADKSIPKQWMLMVTTQSITLYAHCGAQKAAKQHFYKNKKGPPAMKASVNRDISGFTLFMYSLCLRHYSLPSLKLMHETAACSHPPVTSFTFFRHVAFSDDDRVLMANDTHLVQYSMDATLYSRFHLPSSLPLMYDESVPIPALATPPAASWFGKRPPVYSDVLPLMTAVAFSATNSSQHASLSDLAAASAKKVSSEYARFQEERQQRQQLLTEQYEAARRAKEEAAKLGDRPLPQLDANGTTAVVAQTKNKLEERGERLNQLDGKMQDLNANASEFLNNIKAYNQAMEKKKWYQL